MIKGLGRIMLIVVGVFLVVVGILYFVDLKTYTDKVGAILIGVFSILAGLSALFAGLKGKGGFWFTIFSLLMLAGIIYFAVANKEKFSPFSWEYLGKFILSLLTQVIYALGFIFLKIGK